MNDHRSTAATPLPTVSSGDVAMAPADVYPLYVCAREDADEALAAWSAAPAARRREAFAVYRAAADREDTAARMWLNACSAYDAAHALGRAA